MIVSRFCAKISSEFEDQKKSFFARNGKTLSKITSLKHAPCEQEERPQGELDLCSLHELYRGKFRDVTVIRRLLSSAKIMGKRRDPARS